MSSQELLVSVSPPTPAPVLDLQGCVAVWGLGYQIQAPAIAEQMLLSIEPGLPIPKL